MKKLLSFFAALMLSVVAVFAATVVTVDVSQYGTTSFTTPEGITFVADTAAGSVNLPIYNSNDKGLRLYKSNALTITAKDTITKIVFNLNKQGVDRICNVIPSVGTCVTDKDAATVTWQGERTDSLVLIVGEPLGTKASQFCFSVCTLELNGEGGGETPIEEPKYDTLTVAQAVALAQTLNKDTSERVNVVGYVTEIATVYNANKNYISFWVADEADGESAFEFYRATPDPATGSSVKVGDKVIGNGRIVMYVSGEKQIPEFMAGATYQILEAAAPQLPDTLTVAQALEIAHQLAKDETTQETYTVKGVVTSVRYAYSADYGTLSVYVSDSLDNSQDFQFYKAAPATEADRDVKKGDVVVATGNFTRYVNQYELINSTDFKILEAAPADTTQNPDTTIVTPVENDTLTVAEALEVIAELGTATSADEYNVVGYVTEIATPWSDQYGNISLWVADTKDGGQALQLFRVKPLTETDKAVKVGDKVLAVGKLKSYNGTPEMDANGKYCILEAAPNDTTPVTPIENDTLTVAEALEVIAELGTATSADEYNVVGYVTEIATPWSDQYGNISLWVADTKDGGQALQLFRVKPMAETDKAVKVGDKVLAVGKLKSYNGTPEMDAKGKYGIIEVAPNDTTPVTPIENDTLTVAEALEVIAELGTATSADEYNVVGYVTEIATPWSDQYGNISLWVADTKDGGQALQLFRVQPMAETDKAVKVGDKVLAVGKLKSYNGTPEMDAKGKYGIIEVAPNDTTPVTPIENDTLSVAEALELTNALAKDAKTDKEYTIVGYVASIPTSWSVQYGNITLNISDEKDGQETFMLYRVKPELAADSAVKVGDKIVATGILQNFRGNTPEMIAGGKYAIIEVAPNDTTPVTPIENDTLSVAEALELTNALAKDAKTDKEYTIVGYVASIPTSWSVQYGNITLNIADEKDGQETFMLYRVKPELAADSAVKVGDKIVATGILQNFRGNTPEMIAGGKYAIIEAAPNDTTPVTPVEIDTITVAEALDIIAALGNDETKNPYAVIGYVTELDGTYSEEYNDVSLWIADAEDGGKDLYLYHVKSQAEADKNVKAGDRILAVGQLMNYMGNTPEMFTGQYHIIPISGLQLVSAETLVSVVDGQLIVKAQGNVQIYNVAGQMIYNASVAGQTTITGLQQGQVLLVRVNNQIAKVVF